MMSDFAATLPADIGRKDLARALVALRDRIDWRGRQPIADLTAKDNRVISVAKAYLRHEESSSKLDEISSLLADALIASTASTKSAVQIQQTYLAAGLVTDLEEAQLLNRDLVDVQLPQVGLSVADYMRAIHSPVASVRIPPGLQGVAVDFFVGLNNEDQVLSGGPADWCFAPIGTGPGFFTTGRPWRIFQDSLVDLKSPDISSVLRSFVTRFGKTITIGKWSGSSLIGSYVGDVDFEDQKDGIDDCFMEAFYLDTGTVSYMWYAVAISASEYQADLRRRGIDVLPPQAEQIKSYGHVTHRKRP